MILLSSGGVFAKENRTNFGNVLNGCESLDSFLNQHKGMEKLSDEVALSIKYLSNKSISLVIPYSCNKLMKVDIEFNSKGEISGATTVPKNPSLKVSSKGIEIDGVSIDLLAKKNSKEKRLRVKHARGSLTYSFNVKKIDRIIGKWDASIYRIENFKREKIKNPKSLIDYYEDFSSRGKSITNGLKSIALRFASESFSKKRVRKEVSLKLNPLFKKSKGESCNGIKSDNSFSKYLGKNPKKVRNELLNQVVDDSKAYFSKGYSKLKAVVTKKGAEHVLKDFLLPQAIADALGFDWKKEASFGIEGFHSKKYLKRVKEKCNVDEGSSSSGPEEALVCSGAKRKDDLEGICKINDIVKRVFDPFERCLEFHTSIGSGAGAEACLDKFLIKGPVDIAEEILRSNLLESPIKESGGVEDVIKDYRKCIREKVEPRLISTIQPGRGVSFSSYPVCTTENIKDCARESFLDGLNEKTLKLEIEKNIDKKLTESEKSDKTKSILNSYNSCIKENKEDRVSIKIKKCLGELTLLSIGESSSSVDLFKNCLDQKKSKGRVDICKEKLKTVILERKVDEAFKQIDRSGIEESTKEEIIGIYRSCISDEKLLNCKKSNDQKLCKDNFAKYNTNLKDEKVDQCIKKTVLSFKKYLPNYFVDKLQLAPDKINRDKWDQCIKNIENLNLTDILTGIKRCTQDELIPEVLREYGKTKGVFQGKVLASLGQTLKYIDFDKNDGEEKDTKGIKEKVDDLLSKLKELDSLYSSSEDRKDILRDIKKLEKIIESKVKKGNGKKVSLLEVKKELAKLEVGNKYIRVKIANSIEKEVASSLKNEGMSPGDRELTLKRLKANGVIKRILNTIIKPKNGKKKIIKNKTLELIKKTYFEAGEKGKEAVIKNPEIRKKIWSLLGNDKGARSFSEAILSRFIVKELKKRKLDCLDKLGDEIFNWNYLKDTRGGRNAIRYFRKEYFASSSNSDKMKSVKIYLIKERISKMIEDEIKANIPGEKYPRCFFEYFFSKKNIKKNKRGDKRHRKKQKAYQNEGSPFGINGF